MANVSRKAELVQARTADALSELLDVPLSEIDVGYITDALLDRYEIETEKKSKTSSTCAEMGNKLLSEGLVENEDFPCYIGHSAILISGQNWQYENSNPERGCDRSTHLCGSGHIWTTKISKVLTPRWCANGKIGWLGWP